MQKYAEGPTNMQWVQYGEYQKICQKNVKYAVYANQTTNMQNMHGGLCWWHTAQWPPPGPWRGRCRYGPAAPVMVNCEQWLATQLTVGLGGWAQRCCRAAAGSACGHGRLCATSNLAAGLGLGVAGGCLPPRKHNSYHIVLPRNTRH